MQSLYIIATTTTQGLNGCDLPGENYIYYINI